MKTDGFFPRVVDQNWYIDGPLTMDTPFGSTYNHFQNNLSGPALMTPEWMAKLAGSYTIPVIETDFGFRVRYDSGRPIFSIDSKIGPFYASWMGVDGYDPATQLVSAGWHDRLVVQEQGRRGLRHELLRGHYGGPGCAQRLQRERSQFDRLHRFGLRPGQLHRQTADLPSRSEVRFLIDDQSLLFSGGPARALQF